MMMFVCLAALRLAAALNPSQNPFEDSYIDFAGIAVPALAAPLVLQTGVMFAACLWAQFRLEMADYRVSAVTCYYASPLMWPVVMVVTITSMVLLVLFWDSFQGGPDVTGTFRVKLTLLIGGGALLCALVYWWWKLTAALRDVRYANA